MARPKAADPQTGALGTFDGMEVIGTKVNIKRAGDGLSQSLAIEPELLHMHERRFVLLEVMVGPVKFDPVKDTTAKCMRVHDLIAQTVTFVDEEFAREKVAAQKRKIDEARGVHELEFGGGETDGDGDEGTFDAGE